jgi:hypothetical protein
VSLHQHRLRLEALRMRAEIERTELAAALGDLRARTATLRQLASAAGNTLGVVQGGVGGASSWLALATRLLGQKPWVAVLAAGALRLGRHHPLALIAALAAVLVGTRLRAQRRGESGPSS